MRIPYRRTYLPFFLMALALGGLYAASVYNYDLFLSLASLFSIAIALGIFILVWTSRNYLGNNYLLFIGIAYLFIGGLQMAHTLSLEAIYGYGDSTAEHLWVATRYMESLTFLAAPLFIGHKLRPRSVFLAYAIIAPVLLITVILWNLSPAANTRGGGQALFTDTSQYLIALIYASAILLLLQKRRSFNSSVLRLLIAAMTITAGAGIVYAFIKTNDELINMVAHLAQLVSLGCIFQAVVDAGLTRPYQLILRDLSQSREALRHERDTAQKYLDVAGVVFVAIDTSGKVTLINRKGCEILGYPEEKIVGKDWFDNFLPPRLREEVKSVARKLLSGEVEATEYYENPVLTKSGKERTIAWHNVLLRDEDGTIVGHLSSGEDITERQRAEEALRESEEELRRMFSSVTDGIVVTNLDGIITDANEKAVQMYGCKTPRELIGANSLKLVDPTDLPKVMADMNSVLETGADRGIEYGVTRKDGSRFPSETSTSVLKDATGRPTGFISVIRDVTAQKQAEEKLSESEARYRALFETKLEGTFVIDETMKIVLANQAVADMFGFDSIGELYEANLLDYVMPEFQDWAIEHITVGLFKEDRRGLYEIRCMKKNGDEIWVSVTGVRTEYNGKPIGIISTRDITDRKRMAEAIAQSAQRYRSLFENMPGGFVYGKIITDENDKPVDALCLEANDSIEGLVGIKKEQLIGRRFSEIMPALTVSNADLFDVLGEVAATGESARYEDYFEPLGKWVASSIYSPEKGYFTAVFEDITERKQTEEIFRTVSLRSPAGMYVVQDGEFVFANPRFFMNGGTTEDELLGTHSLDRVHPDDREMVRQNAIAMLKGERTTPYEYRIVNENGEVEAWLSETVVSIQYHGKRAVLGNVVDITEQKQAEEIFQTIALNSPASIYIAQDGKFVFTNPRLRNRISYTEEGLSNIEPQDLIHRDDREMVRQNAIAMLKGERTTPYEYRSFTNTGEMLWVAETVAPIEYQGRRAVLGSILDITERKQAENLLSDILKNSPVSVYILQDDRFQLVNPAFSRNTGYTEAELLAMDPSKLIHPDDVEMVTEKMAEMLKGKLTRPFEFRGINKDGSVQWIITSVAPIEYRGRPAVLATPFNITERRRMEEALRHSEESFRAVTESAHQAIITIDAQTRIVLWNKAAEKIYGYSADEAVGQPLTLIMPERLHQAFQDEIEAMLSSQNSSPPSGMTETVRLRKDGTEIPVGMTLAKWQAGKETFFTYISRDITVQKQAEERLRESELRYRQLVETSPDMIATTDLKANLLFANKEWKKHHGYSDREIKRISILSMLHPDDTRAVKAAFARVMRGQSVANIECRTMRKNGSYINILANLSPISDSQGKVTNVLIASMDITERKQAEEIFQTIVLSSPASIYILQDGKYVFNNDEFLKNAGYSKDEILNTDPQDIIHPEDREMVRQNAIAMLKGERTTPYEYRALNKNGDTMWVTETIASIQYQGKRAILGSALNNTERKQAEEIFQTLSLSSPVGMYIVQDGKFVFANPQFISDLGMTEDRVLGRRSLARVRREDRETVRKNARAMLKGERTTPYEYAVTSRDGESRWFMETVAPIQYQGKRAVLGSVLDITERKKNEERLRDTRRRFRDLVNLLPLSVTEMDDKLNITFANKKAIEDSGYNESEVNAAPLNPLDVFILEDRERVKENIQRILNGETLGRVEYTQTRRDGSTYPVVTYSAPILQDGKAVGLRTVTIDVTEQKEAEREIAEKNRELEEANARLQEVDRLKSIFLSSMSHELRTPLNSIIGFTSLILDGMTGDINEEQREQLSLVKSSSNHLLSLINDVLDISKIEAGKVELSLEEFPLNELISEVVDILTPAAQTKGIELTAETDGEIQLYTDRRRFKQVLINLGGNAVKFTEQGSVRIIAALHEENGHTHDDTLEVHVIDTGIGIENEDIDKLFAPFQQVDGSLTRRFEGTGLGLHHSRKILQMLGGDIWIKSEYGKGSDFGLTLPLEYRGDENNEENTGSG
ncbi:MAG TPA: PAS domain S-box protein [Dehalococcoidia bacterium]|nr:PAS domain S-box protein [Dehalococcoidia bacterium]